MSNIVSLIVDRFKPEDITVEDFVAICKENSADRMRLGVYPRSYQGGIFYQDEAIRIVEVNFSMAYSGIRGNNPIIVREPEPLFFPVFHTLNQHNKLRPLPKLGGFDDDSRWTGLFQEAVDRALVCASYGLPTKLLIYSAKRDCLANLIFSPEDNQLIDNFTTIIDDLTARVFL